ncbi:MAG: hypothetical protein IKM27_07700 [Clostridia bacterium]|nr:hypothetical protein [Clostridia bacterium]
MALISIGIDLGHCETAAACPTKNAKGEFVVTRLDTSDGNKQVITTQIIITNSQMERLKNVETPSYELLKEIGPFKIGDCPAYVPDGERFIYFKAAPKDFHKPYGFTDKAKECGMTHGKIMACYAYALVENIFMYNPDVIPQHVRKDAELLVGCPTTKDWVGDGERKKYSWLIKTATGIKTVRIIPESRAAMFSSVENSNSHVSAINGAVVFDFGSSTADCTYMLLGRKLLEFSWTLGASEMEHQMMRAVLSSAMNEAGPFDPDMDNLINVSDELRKAKEAYYSGLYPPTGKALICTFTEADTNAPIDSMVRIGERFMNNISANKEFSVLCDSVSSMEGSWEKLCFEFFKDAKRRISEATYKNEKGEEVECPVNTVVITGGASKMSFIEPLCRLVFNDPDVTIITNKVNPSHTVSNGLGWVAVTDNNLPASKRNIKNKILTDKLFTDLVNDISDGVFAYLKGVAEAEVNKWAELPGDTATVAQLKESIENAVKGEETTENCKAICDKEIDEWKTAVANTIEHVINDEVQRLYSGNVAKNLMLPKDIWSELNGSGMNTDTIVMDNILADIDLNGITASVVRGIAQLVIWTIGILLAPESFGISILAAWFVSSMAGDAMSDNDLDKPRTQAIRKNIAGKIGGQMDKKKEEIMANFKGALNNHSQSFEPVIDSMITVALEIVTLQRFDM